MTVGETSIRECKLVTGDFDNNSKNAMQKSSMRERKMPSLTKLLGIHSIVTEGALKL